MEHGLEDRDTHTLLLDQIGQARHVQQTYPGRYALVAAPYALPVGFAAKGSIVLAEIPSSLARHFFGGSAMNLHGGQMACYRIEGDEELKQRLSQLFDDLAEEARKSDQQHATATWLDDLLSGDASRRGQRSELLNDGGPYM